MVWWRAGIHDQRMATDSTLVVSVPLSCSYVFLFCFFTPNAPNLTDRKLDNYQFCVPHQGTGNPEDIQPPCTHYSVWSHCHLREEPKQVSNMTA